MRSASFLAALSSPTSVGYAIFWSATVASIFRVPLLSVSSPSRAVPRRGTSRQEGRPEDRRYGGRPENSVPHGRRAAQRRQEGGRAHDRPAVRAGGALQKAEGLPQDSEKGVPCLLEKEEEDEKGDPQDRTQAARLPETGPGPYRKTVGHHRGAAEDGHGRRHVPRHARPVPFPVPPAPAGPKDLLGAATALRPAETYVRRKGAQRCRQDREHPSTVRTPDTQGQGQGVHGVRGQDKLQRDRRDGTH